MGCGQFNIIERVINDHIRNCAVCAEADIENRPLPHKGGNLMAWKEVEADLNIWLPEKNGDVLEGDVKQKKEGQYGNQWLIDNGSEKGLWTPSHKVLQNRMEKVALGDHVRITRTESLAPAKRGYNPTIIYKVEVEE